MSQQANTNTSAPTSAVRNTGVKDKETVLGSNGVPTPSTDLQDYCERNYDQIMPIMAEKYLQKQKQQKLSEVKAHLAFKEASQQSESRTPHQKKDLRRNIEAKR
ncbi:hypothetical protein CTI12_AA095970 [Artemisia annua]|uniref:Uncharacterized protein n=1 Tax=Artemisia annua TaxID=35608 RepID=A0A2U1PYV2_ARTAN|nr:hypothetical protein CTI12_AA095970 [Artemisia annua]